MQAQDPRTRQDLHPLLRSLELGLVAGFQGSMLSLQAASRQASRGKRGRGRQTIISHHGTAQAKARSGDRPRAGHARTRAGSGPVRHTPIAMRHRLAMAPSELRHQAHHHAARHPFAAHVALRRLLLAAAAVNTRIRSTLASGGATRPAAAQLAAERSRGKPRAARTSERARMRWRGPRVPHAGRDDAGSARGVPAAGPLPANWRRSGRRGGQSTAPLRVQLHGQCAQATACAAARD